MTVSTRGHNSSELAGSRPRVPSTSGGVESRHANQFMEAPQVAAGENPLFGVTDASQGRETTREWGVKLGAGTRQSMDTAGVAPGPLTHPDDDPLAPMRAIIYMLIYVATLGAMFALGWWLA